MPAANQRVSDCLHDLVFFFSLNPTAAAPTYARGLGSYIRPALNLTESKCLLSRSVFTAAGWKEYVIHNPIATCSSNTYRTASAQQAVCFSRSALSSTCSMGFCRLGLNILSYICIV